MVNITFFVYKVAGKARPRFDRRSGRAYTLKATRDAEADIAAAYIHKSLNEYGEVKTAPKGTPVHVQIKTARPLPVSRPRGIESEQDTFKPDIDNVAKLVLDGLCKAPAYEDDAQVVELNITKLPRVRDVDECMSITIAWSDEEEH